MRRLQMLPTGAAVIPGLRRHAYGRIRHPMAAAFAWAAAPEIASQAARHDVVHVWGDGFFAAAGVRAARQTGRPVLVTPFVHPGRWGDDPASAAAYRKADWVIGLLETDCAVLRNLGVEPSRVVECSVCSPGVTRGSGEAWRQEHGVRGPLVLFLGVRRAYKGFEILLEAIPELARRVPDATVAFAGPGEPIRTEHALPVIDCGPVSDAERAALLDAADVYCLPSASEIFPVTILEAWSAKTAVVTSDLPPLVELMKRSGGGTACAREPHAIVAALEGVLSDAAGRGTMAAAGYAYWNASATVEAVVARHVQLYRDALNATGS